MCCSDLPAEDHAGRKGVGEQNPAAPRLWLTGVHALLSHALLRLLQAND